MSLGYAIGKFIIRYLAQKLLIRQTAQIIDENGMHTNNHSLLLNP